MSEVIQKEDGEIQLTLTKIEAEILHGIFYQCVGGHPTRGDRHFIENIDSRFDELNVLRKVYGKHNAGYYLDLDKPYEKQLNPGCYTIRKTVEPEIKKEQNKMRFLMSNT
jgi:hypothetical protein